MSFGVGLGEVVGVGVAVGTGVGAAVGEGVGVGMVVDADDAVGVSANVAEMLFAS